MSKVKSIKAREILDSRGEPTVQAIVTTVDGNFLASVPAGASKGEYEAKELRDGGERYGGKGVLKAVYNVEKIIGPKLKGKNVTKQKEIDQAMIALDGTEDKSNLGANAILGVSMAVARAGASAQKSPLWKYINQIYNRQFTKSTVAAIRKSTRLPIPCFNILNGGAHAGNDLDIQEFMVVPQLRSFSSNLQLGVEIYSALKGVLKGKFGPSAINLGDEGGFAPPIFLTEQALDFIIEAIKKRDCQNQIKLILDVAASQFYQGKRYRMRGVTFTRQGLIKFYSHLIEQYPIMGLEDPFAQDDWLGFKRLTKKLGNKIIIIGDDLLVTNTKRMKQAQAQGACNGTILKPNQVGTVSETIEAAHMARGFGWKIIVSHRSGETCDDFIADFAVGIGADFIKSGAPARGERVAKYNRLLQIEQEI